MAADFTIADVLAWARTKPAVEEYCYTDSGNCALCQFLKDTGRVENPSLGGNHGNGATLYNTGEIIPAPLCVAAAAHPRTFGGFVAHLEKLCPETPITQSNWSAIDAYLTDIEAVESVPA